MSIMEAAPLRLEELTNTNELKLFIDKRIQRHLKEQVESYLHNRIEDIISKVMNSLSGV